MYNLDKPRLEFENRNHALKYYIIGLARIKRDIERKQKQLSNLRLNNPRSKYKREIEDKLPYLLKTRDLYRDTLKQIEAGVWRK